MGTNYYVQTPACANACAHCTEIERIHLGKSFGRGGFLFRAEPEWPRHEAFAHWVRRALTGTITDEYGRGSSLAELLDLADPISGNPSHFRDADFESCGREFSDREFS